MNRLTDPPSPAPKRVGGPWLVSRPSARIHRVLPPLLAALALTPGHLVAAGVYREASIQVCVPAEFILFALTLLGVALFHRYTVATALTGLAVITSFKLNFTGFSDGSSKRPCDGSFSESASWDKNRRWLTAYIVSH